MKAIVLEALAVAVLLALVGLALAARSDDAPGPSIGEGEDRNAAGREERDPSSNHLTDDTPSPHVGHGVDGNVAWRAEREPSSNRLTTTVWITSEPWRDANQQERTATLLLYCSPTVRVFVLKTGELQPRGDVTWRTDDGPEVAEFWTKPNWARRGELFPLCRRR